MKILDCTIRDGGYLNNWKFEDKVVREVYRSVSKSGVDIIELGFKTNKESFKNVEFGPWRYTEESKLKECRKVEKALNVIKGKNLELKKVFKSGIAFHHAGLLPKEKKIIEDILDQRKLSYSIEILDIQGDKYTVRNNFGSTIVYIKKDNSYFLEDEMK